MQLYNSLTFEEIVARHSELFHRIPVVIDDGARENDCYPNCLRKLERDGGRVVTGWRRTPVLVDAEVIASLDHHAVWESPQGDLIDISPRILVFDGRFTIIEDQFTDFMVDPTALFGEDKKALPSRHMPLVPDPRELLKEACERMDRRAELWKMGEMEKARYETGKIVTLLRKQLNRK